MRSLISQLNHTVRVLLKAPGFTITAVLIPGFGIGANTAIFSLINAVLLRPLPYSHPERLVKVLLPYQNSSADTFDYPDYMDVAGTQSVFDNIALVHGDFLDLTGSGETQRLWVQFVSPSLFTLTGRATILGRTFNNQEDIPHGPLLAVISERFWRTHFNADPNVIGKRLTLSEQSFEIIGVTPAQIDIWGPPPVDVYLPVNSITPFDYPIDQRTFRIFGCLGRLKEGGTIPQAQAELDVIYKGLIDRYPDAALCLSAIGLYGVLAYSVSQRHREIGVRIALGAESLKILQLVAQQGFKLIGLGLLAGTIVALGCAHFIEGMLYGVSAADPISLLSAILVLSLAGCLACWLPALRAMRINPVTALRE